MITDNNVPFDKIQNVQITCISFAFLLNLKQTELKLYCSKIGNWSPQNIPEKEPSGAAKCSWVCESCVCFLTKRSKWEDTLEIFCIWKWHGPPSLKTIKNHHVLLLILLGINFPWIALPLLSTRTPCVKSAAFRQAPVLFMDTFARHGDVTPATWQQIARVNKVKQMTV